MKAGILAGSSKRAANASWPLSLFRARNGMAALAPTPDLPRNPRRPAFRPF
jgi:hypothetical protein